MQDCITAGLVGTKLDFVLVESPLPQNGSGKACSLGKGRLFELEQVCDMVFTVPVAGMEEAEAAVYVRKRVMVATQADYKQGAVAYAGVVKASHAVAMTTWFWDGQAPTIRVNTLEGTARITVSGSFTEVNYRQKVALPGGKASISPEPGVRLFDAFTEEDLTRDGLVVFTGETAKGKQFIAQAAAEWWVSRNAACVWPAYDPNVGYTETHLAIMGRYVRENTKLVDIVYAIEDVQYGIFAGLYAEDPAWSFYENGVVVHRCRALFGQVVAAVEYTSTYVNIGDDQELIPEILYNIASVMPELAEAFWDSKKARARRGAFQGLLRMLHNGEPQGATVLALDPDVGVKFDPTLTDRELAEGFASLYPKGLIVTWDAYRQYVDMGTLLSIGAFAPGGESYGFAHELIALLRYLHVDNEKAGDPTARMRFHFRKFTKSLKGTLAKSKKALSKTIRCGKLRGRKIDSTYRRGMGLWELHVNPEDYLVTSGLMKAGDIDLDFRIPVYNATAWKVVLDPLTPCGVFQVHPLCWHAANEGDVDGDGVADLPLPKHLQHDAWNRFHAAEHGGWRGYFTLRGADSNVLNPA